jgi:Glucose/sorbosone dehydrogenases
MNRRRFLSLAGVAGAGSVAGCVGDTDGGADGTDGDDGTASPGPPADYTVETVANGLAFPWAVEPLPDESGLLVTERTGRLLLVDTDGGVETVEGTPEVYAEGQGGLLDVTLSDPDETGDRWVYLTYSASDGEGRSATHLGRGRLDREAGRLRAFERLHVAEPFVASNGHFGSRVVVRSDEVFVTVGDRQSKAFGPEHNSQDLTNELGTTLRLRLDGTVPTDNPFVDRPDARDAIYSYGHRNAQGMAVQPETGDVWQSEFGEQDGDEINVLERGANYGWPVADEGCTYGSGEPIGVSHDERSDVVAPVYSWPCGSGGFPPSGTTFYDGSAFPWQGDLLVGGLASQYLARFGVDGRDVTDPERLLADRGWRVRDVAVGPESGAVYVAVDDGDAPVVRLVPA